jgi:hypothetical protein
MVGAACLMIVPFVMWIGTSPVRYAAFEDLYMKRATRPYTAKLAAEKVRYADFLGFGSQRVSLPFRTPFPIPYRIHVAAAAVGAAAFLLASRRSRKLAVGLIAALAINAWWWSTLVNKSSRYFAVLAPLIALLVAFAAYELLQRPRWRRPALAGVAILIASQVAGNLLLVARYRNADYPALSRELRRTIPQGASAYGAITFWLALHDRKYYSFDRAPFEYAVSNLRPQYLILNDRVMARGTGYGINEYEDLRRDWNAFAQKEGELVRTIRHPYYGDLDIYRVPAFFAERSP